MDESLETKSHPCELEEYGRCENCCLWIYLYGFCGMPWRDARSKKQVSCALLSNTQRKVLDQCCTDAESSAHSSVCSLQNIVIKFGDQKQWRYQQLLGGPHMLCLRNFLNTFRETASLWDGKGLTFEKIGEQVLLMWY